VSARLAEHGAAVIDADAIAREVVEPGTPGLTAVVDRFGPDVLTADGALDRPKLAGIVFADEQARADLNAIVHPLVGARTGELMAAVDGGVVVYDVPLLVESNLTAGFDVVVVVVADEDLRVQRLEGRGMPAADARARIAAQATDEQRRAVADEVVDNSGTLEQLHAAVDALWERLVQRGGGVEAGSGVQ
jgi:dephospho-CoA kinase